MRIIGIVSYQSIDVMVKADLNTLQKHLPKGYMADT